MSPSRLERSTLQQIIPVLRFRKSGAHSRVFLSLKLIGALLIIVATLSERSSIPCNLPLPRESASVRSAVVLSFGGRRAAVLSNAFGSAWYLCGLTDATIATRDSGAFAALTRSPEQPFFGCNAVPTRRFVDARIREQPSVFRRPRVSSFIRSAAFVSDLLSSPFLRECSTLPTQPRSIQAARLQT